MSSAHPEVRESKLSLFIREIVYRKEPLYLYILPGVFLSISSFAVVISISVILTNTLMGRDLAESIQQVAYYAGFVRLYVGYVVFSAIASYKYSSLVIKHLIDSGLTTYYWLRESGDYDSIRALYVTGLIRRNIPSPTTSLLLTLLTLGLGYPFILYVLEKNLRKHCIGEESKFLNKRLMSEIDSGNLVVDILLTIVTLGLYMIFYSSRLARVYNKHVDTIHSNHPHRPNLLMHVSRDDLLQHLSKSPVFLTSLLFLAVGLASFLQLFNITIYYIVTVVSGLYVYGISLIYSKNSFSKQIACTLLAVYTSFGLSTIVGLTGYGMYSDVLKYFRSVVEAIGKDPVHQLVFIFVNNLTIALLSLPPLLGSFFIGSGLSNAGLIYGVIVAYRLARGDFSPLILFILPHAVLELLAYSLFVSLSTRIPRVDTGVFAKTLIASILTLFIAAIVEVLTIQIT